MLTKTPLSLFHQDCQNDKTLTEFEWVKAEPRTKVLEALQNYHHTLKTLEENLTPQLAQSSLDNLLLELGQMLEAPQS